MLPKIGDRIKLVRMPDDPDPIKPGSVGTVNFVAEQPAMKFTQIGVKWDNGRNLILCVPPDSFKIVKEG